MGVKKLNRTTMTISKSRDEVKNMGQKERATSKMSEHDRACLHWPMLGVPPPHEISPHL